MNITTLKKTSKVLPFLLYAIHLLGICVVYRELECSWFRHRAIHHLSHAGQDSGNVRLPLSHRQSYDHLFTPSVHFHHLVRSVESSASP